MDLIFPDALHVSAEAKWLSRLSNAGVTEPSETINTLYPKALRRRKPEALTPCSLSHKPLKRNSAAHKPRDIAGLKLRHSIRWAISTVPPNHKTPNPGTQRNL